MQHSKQSGQRRLLRRSALATGIAFALNAGAIAPVAAQDDELLGNETSEEEARPQAEPEQPVDTMVVTGYRGSILRSLDRKRNAVGIRDSVTAEDLADFPDQNLAESLQRIPGVAINRVANEGSQITVRGLGPEFNLVTLNGRSMPTAGNRSFDFADLATVGVSAVDVYKTAIAELPSGGIGATVNILTPRPLDRPGFRAVISGKAVHETSSSDSDTLDEVTPEFEGLFSHTFFDDKFGILLSGAFHERDNREEFAEVANWRPTDGTTAGPLNNPLASGNVNNNNQRADGIFF
ncbi:MAG: TonB-dependent receptor plug domain-containing protein, partial [Wenzhouxiangellaceae bacterium]